MGTKKDLQAKNNSARHRKSVIPEISEAELLRRVRAMVLDNIQPAERPIGATAKGRKSPLQTTMIAIRIPVSLHDELAALGGAKSRHVERAIMFYLKAMKAEAEGADNA